MDDFNAEEFILNPEREKPTAETAEFDIEIAKNELPDNDRVFPSLSDWNFAEEQVKRAYLNAGFSEEDWLLFPEKDATITRRMEETYRAVRGTALSLWDKLDVDGKRKLFQAGFIESEKIFPARPEGESREEQPVRERETETATDEASAEPEPPPSEVPGAMSGIVGIHEDIRPGLSPEQRLQRDVFEKYRDMLKELQGDQKAYREAMKRLMDIERKRRQGKS